MAALPGVAPPVPGSGPAASPAEVQRLLMGLLTNGGHVGAFVDAFYLAHRARMDVEDKGDSAVVLGEVAAHLAAAEAGRRAGDSSAVLAGLRGVADVYRRGEKHTLASHFFERAEGLSRSAGDASSSMTALHDLGLACEAAGDLSGARVKHEEHWRLARHADNADAASQAASQLLRVNTALATQAEERGDAEASLQLHQEALEAAQHCGDTPAEGLACWSVGRAFVLAGRPAQAIPYLKSFLRIAAETPGLEGRVGQAFAALAAAHQADGDLTSAAECLEELVSIAESTGDGLALAEAAETLGLLYSRQGRGDDATGSLEVAFAKRRELAAEGRCPRSAVDRVRILLGMVRGDARLGPFVRSVVSCDVGTLLNWRAHSTDLLPPGAAAVMTTAAQRLLRISKAGTRVPVGTIDVGDGSVGSPSVAGDGSWAVSASSAASSVAGDGFPPDAAAVPAAAGGGGGPGRSMSRGLSRAPGGGAR